MGAYWVVLTAAALTTLVAAALATALAVFAGQELPLALRHDLAAATGTSLTLTGTIGPHQTAQDNAALDGIIRSALHRVPFSFYQADWSDPLGLVAGSRPGPAGQRRGRKHPADPGRVAERHHHTGGAARRTLADRSRRGHRARRGRPYR